MTLRRLLAAVLLITFLGESSGSASAATPGALAQIGFDLAAIMSPLRAAAINSQVFAQFTGQGNRYAAMHARPPEFPRHSVDARKRDIGPRGERPAQMIEHVGVRELVELPKAPPRGSVHDRW